MYLLFVCNCSHAAPTLEVSLTSHSHHFLDISPNNTGDMSCLGRVTPQQFREPFKYKITWHNQTANGPLTQIGTALRKDTAAKDEISVEFTRSGSYTFFCTVIMDVSPAKDDITSTRSITVFVQGKRNVYCIPSSG